MKRKKKSGEEGVEPKDNKRGKLIPNREQKIRDATGGFAFSFEAGTRISEPLSVGEGKKIGLI